VGRKNRRNKREYRDRLGFNPRKYIQKSVQLGQPGHSGQHGQYGQTMQSAQPTEQRPLRRPAQPQDAGRPYRTPYRGEVWFAELGSHPGTSVQDGCRPVLIISNDKGNHHASTVVVLPMTSHLKKFDLPSHVELRQEHLTRIDPNRPLEPSMVLAEQITTISKSALRSYLGIVEKGDKLTEIDNAVRTQLGISISQQSQQSQESQEP
jgi:mRNA interferase MazF